MLKKLRCYFGFHDFESTGFKKTRIDFVRHGKLLAFVYEDFEYFMCKNCNLEKPQECYVEKT